MTPGRLMTPARRRVLEALNDEDRYLVRLGHGAWEIQDGWMRRVLSVGRFLGRQIADSLWVDQHIYDRDVYTLSDQGRDALETD